MTDFEWTEAMVEKLVDMTKAGASYSKIAKVIGCHSRSAVGGKISRLRDAGVFDGRGPCLKAKKQNHNRGRQSPGLAHVPLIKERLKQGKNDRQIADEIGLMPDDVRYVRRIKKLKSNNDWGAPPKYANALARLVESGKSDREIAQALGITVNQSRYERRRQGLKPPISSQHIRVATIASGDSSLKIAAVFTEGFMGQRSRVALTELETGHCKFPIDQTDGTVRYCGDQAEDGRSYCQHHASRCYTAARPKHALKPSHVYAARG